MATSTLFSQLNRIALPAISAADRAKFVDASIKTPKHTFASDLPTLAKCVKVYDGDTIWFVVYCHGKLVRHIGRMKGYNSAELKPPKYAADGSARSPEDILAELTAGKAARDYLSSLILNEVILVKMGDYDKYGRILIEAYYTAADDPLGHPRSVCETMLATKHGAPYFGAGEKRW